MNPSEPKQPAASGGSAANDPKSLVELVCLPYLLEAQNEDGGWGFAQRHDSRVEPASWALMALNELARDRIGAPVVGDAAISRGYEFLERAQLPDGSWPSAAGQATGSWVTSLACWALAARDNLSPKLAAGVRWLREDLPGDAQFWWRFMRRVASLASGPKVNKQSENYWGWSWTAGTASWVEPTAQALIALRNARVESLGRDAEQRQELAETMLYDRMCPGGGWNCGNPMVYGVAGEPLVGPTVWALLALRAHSERQENQQSLDWLTQNWMKIQSPGSLALSEICLKAYGRKTPEIRSALAALYAHGEFARTVPVIAWTSLAMNESLAWLDLGASASVGRSETN